MQQYLCKLHVFKFEIENFNFLTKSAPTPLTLVCLSGQRHGH